MRDGRDLFPDGQGADSVSSLRDVSLEDLSRHWDKLDPVGRKRARHVLTENDRVQRGADRAARRETWPNSAGSISASHASSRDDFENSSPALDALVEAAESAPGFLGGKLSGAGWAGCTVNLVRADQADAFAETVRTAYARTPGSDSGHPHLPRRRWSPRVESLLNPGVAPNHQPAVEAIQDWMVGDSG